MAKLVLVVPKQSKYLKLLSSKNFVAKESITHFDAVLIAV